MGTQNGIQVAYVKITVTDQKDEVIFYSSDPIEIEKQNLNGLGLNCIIDIDGLEYNVTKLSISIFSTPMDYEFGIDLNENSLRGRKIPYLCDIKIMV